MSQEPLDPTNPTDLPEGGGDTPQPGTTVQPISIHGLSEATVQALAALAHSYNVLDLVSTFVHNSGVAGEDQIIRLLYLAMTSRLLDEPVSVVIKGPSSGGKSFLMKSVLRLFPESAYYRRTSVSPMLLVRTAESFIHRVIVFEELAGLNKNAELFLRMLLSEGRIVHSTLEQGESKKLEEVTYTKEGPTSLILTTTETRIHPENETRMLSLTVNDTREHTRTALRAAAKVHQAVSDPIAFVLFQEWLRKRQDRVVVPYVDLIAEHMAPVSTRLRRDFQKVISLTMAHALLHSRSRPRDTQGRIVAQPEDYTTVYDLVADVISDAVEASVSPAVREVVEAVAKLLPKNKGGVQQKMIVPLLDVDKSGVSRRIRDVIEKGYLVNLQEKSGAPYRVVLGDPLPDNMDVLPHPSKIFGGCAVAPDSGMGDAASMFSDQPTVEELNNDAE